MKNQVAIPGSPTKRILLEGILVMVVCAIVLGILSSPLKNIQGEVRVPMNPSFPAGIPSSISHRGIPYVYIRDAFGATLKKGDSFIIVLMRNGQMKELSVQVDEITQSREFDNSDFSRTDDNEFATRKREYYRVKVADKKGEIKKHRGWIIVDLAKG